MLSWPARGLAMVGIACGACGRIDFAPLGDGGGAGGDGIACSAPGGLQAMRTAGVGESPLTLAAGDLDGDGHVDLAVIDEGDNTMDLMRGDGTGRFSLAQTVPVGTDPKFAAIADLDGDGKPEVLVANGGDNTVWLFAGTGAFDLAAHSLLSTDITPRWIAFGVLTASGLTDLVVENSFGYDVGVYLATAPGQFSPPVYYGVGVPTQPHGMVLVDLDGDGALDVATSNITSETVSILWGAGDGTFSSSPQTLAGTVYPGSISAADLDRDGILDLVVANTTDGTVGVYRGLGGRGFALQQTFPDPGGPNTAFVADLTGDGILDVVTSNGGDVGSTGAGEIALLAGKGDGTLAPPVTFPAGIKPWGIIAADVNGDGRPDVEIVDEGANTDTGPQALGVFLDGCP